MRSGGKAVARRASALLMSALLAFSTCPVEAMAQEQDDGETESPVLLVDDDGVTTDEMGNFAQELPPTEPIEDEILDQTAEDEAEPLEEDLNQTPEDTDEAGQPVGEETQGTEEPTVTEDSQEASESLSIEPIREQSTGTMLVDENPSGKSYFFDLSDEADKTTAKVKVYGMTSGNVSYDAATGTLQLNNANVNGEIESDGDITLELVGGNTVRGYDSFYEGSYYDNEARDYVYYEDYANGHKNSYDAAIDVNGMLTVNSDGSINTYYSVSCTSLEIKNGTIDSSINTNGGKATISGGTVSSVDTNGGSATVSGGDVGSVYTSGGNATVSGGTVNDGVYTGKRNDDEEYTVLGDLSISNGTTYGGISCGKLTVTDGTIISGDDYYDKNQLSCTSLEMKGGKIDGTAYTNGGNATVTGGNITSDIDAGNGSRYSESTAWGNVTISNGTIGADISCSILKINGKTKIGGKAYTHGSDATVTGGTITGGVNTGKRNDDEDYVGWG
ncbi:MAG: hypothetical protein IKG11_01630, partial [Atopobiaceae bacterium]|nr:hypothetical protein [Atopobiaceae bacterium]